MNDLYNMLMNNPGINPQVKEVLDMVRESDMSPKDLFYKMAQEKGVDPESILNQLENLARFK